MRRPEGRRARLAGRLPLSCGRRALSTARSAAMYAALTREADSLRAGGDSRTRGQIMADTLVERLTGQSRATGVPIAVNLVVSDTALLRRDQQPGFLDGHGPVPAAMIRELATDPETSVEIRRLYARPETGELVAMDSRSRCFRASAWPAEAH